MLISALISPLFINICLTSARTLRWTWILTNSTAEAKSPGAVFWSSGNPSSNFRAFLSQVIHSNSPWPLDAVLIEERFSEKMVPAAGSTLTPFERGFLWNDATS